MQEEDNIIVKWAQEDVETSYNLLNKNKDLLSYNLKMASCKPKHVAAMFF